MKAFSFFPWALSVSALLFFSLPLAFGRPSRDADPAASSFASVAPISVVPRIREANPEGTFVAEHGKLSVQGSALVDETGRPVRLRGMSAFWINWEAGRKYVNREAIGRLARDWGISVYRIAVGVEPEGAYASDPAAMAALVSDAIDACIENGIYVIVDWHVHEALPYGKLEAAFFKGIAKAYGKYPNVIYELWNEPIHVSWRSQIKPFAEDLIRNAVRPIDDDNLILVGTSSWSQDVDDCARDPIQEVNVMYTLHFYAGTHGEGLRRKADAAIEAGLPVFVSEWGSSAADGGSNGQVYLEASDAWLEWMDGRGLSWANWSVSDKAESSAALRPGADPEGNWTDDDLTPSGRYVRDRIKAGR